MGIACFANEVRTSFHVAVEMTSLNTTVLCKVSALVQVAMECKSLLVWLLFAIVCHEVASGHVQIKVAEVLALAEIKTRVSFVVGLLYDNLVRKFFH